MKNQKRQAGFTLIELMIVIAIIGILMAYAIPAYRDYSVRSKRGECNAVVDGIKTPIAEYYYNKGVFASNLGELGLGAMDGANISVALSGDTATCTPNAAAGGSTLDWTATLAGSVFNWACDDNTGTAAWDVCPK
ncbi:MAG: prepilin-type N-terminal cleavage/methylation domain-containing protein [Pseudomonadota bacterium]